MTVRAARAVEGARERTIPALMILTGMAMLFVLAFDQGQLLSYLLGDTAYQKNVLHEFFHDGRHILRVPCH